MDKKKDDSKDSMSLEDMATFANLDIFKKDRSGDVPNTNGDTIKKVASTLFHAPGPKPREAWTAHSARSELTSLSHASLEQFAYSVLLTPAPSIGLGP